jgi:hypothetical protein
VGLGLSTSGSPRVGLYASFIPTPHTTYQITPSKKFYVVARELGVNQPKPDDVDFAQMCQIDFAVQSSHIQLVHNDDSMLSILDGESPSSARL